MIGAFHRAQSASLSSCEHSSLQWVLAQCGQYLARKKKRFCGLVPGVDVNTRFEVNNGIVFKILRVTVNK